MTQWAHWCQTCTVIYASYFQKGTFYVKAQGICQFYSNTLQEKKAAVVKVSF